MKLLVFSDSHGRELGMERAIDKHKYKCDAVIFLGDGIRDIESIRAKYPTLAFFTVRGNCDFMADVYENEAVLTLEDKRIFITHGHLYGAKGGYGKLIYRAEELEADMVLFGHTHVPCEEAFEINGKRITLFNPGSIGTEGRYGVINIVNGVFVCGHGKSF